MNYTSIEQSKHLLELGLAPETADMSWEKVTHNLEEEFSWEVFLGANPAIKMNTFSFRNGYVIPCWSVGALLDIIPPIITTLQDIYYFKVLKADCGYSIRYESKTQEVLLSSYQRELIGACYETVVWLLQNNYIKKGE